MSGILRNIGLATWHACHWPNTTPCSMADFSLGLQKKTVEWELTSQGGGMTSIVLCPPPSMGNPGHKMEKEIE